MSTEKWFQAVKFRWTMVVAVVGIVLDQWTKRWVVDNIRYRTEEIHVIDGFLSLVHAQNKGAAMGLLNEYDHRMLVFAVFTVVALVVLGQMYTQIPKADRVQSLALGLVLSGALGNAIDRIDKQSVTDFVRVYTEHPTLQPWLIETFGTYEWPSFNVADAAICVGLGIFVLHFSFLQEDEEDLEPAPPDRPLEDPGDFAEK